MIEVSFLLHALFIGATASYVHIHRCDMHGVRQAVGSPTSYMSMKVRCPQSPKSCPCLTHYITKQFISLMHSYTYEDNTLKLK